MTITIPADQATDRQLLLAILEGITTMTEQTTRLQAAVDQELADDAAQNTLIEQQEGLIAELRDALDNAIASGAADREALAQAYAIMDEASTKLESNDPTEPTPTPDPEPEPEPTPDPDPEPEPTPEPEPEPQP